MIETVSYICDLILLFFAFSVLGWCMEVVLKYRQFHRFINRGFLVGPYLPIYGTGVTLATVVVGLFSKYDDSIGATFLASFIACGTLEYLVSYFMEKRFHARWWDYSQKPMNLNGRVWIGNLILFGLAGTIIVKVVDPVFFGWTIRIPFTVKWIVCLGIGAVMITDYVLSHIIMKLVKSGIEHSEADNTEEIGRELQMMIADKSVFHKRMLEAYPEVVYRTDRVKERLKTMKEESELLRKEIGERLAAEKQNIIDSIEPVTMIKSDIIARQDELIRHLESGQRSPEEEAQLKDYIDRRKNLLKQRESMLSKVVNKVKQQQE